MIFSVDWLCFIIFKIASTINKHAISRSENAKGNKLVKPLNYKRRNRKK